LAHYASARAHRHAAATAERADSVAAERLAGIRTVRTFAQEEAEMERYSRALDDAATARAAANTVHALHLALFAAVPSTAVAAWLWYGGQLVERGRLTVGELSCVVPLALEVANSLAGLSELHGEIVKGVDAADRAAAVLGARQNIEAGGERLLVGMSRKQAAAGAGAGDLAADANDAAAVSVATAEADAGGQARVGDVIIRARLPELLAVDMGS